MNVQEIKELMQTMAQTGVTSLDWNSCGAAIHLERQISSGNADCGTDAGQIMDDSDIDMTSSTAAKQVAASDNLNTTEASAKSMSVETASEAVLIEDKPGELVKSPVVGIYYSAPSPDGDPFVRQGSRIEKGNPLCIIEAMKLMNEVSSPYSGEIVEILVENGQRVEYGQPLFRIV